MSDGEIPEPPWLQPELLARLQAMAEAHRRAFARPLLACNPGLTARQFGQELFAAPQVLLAHDGASDPCLIYANRAALLLWRRTWSDMVGLPSRLTAEPSQRAARARALAQVREGLAVQGYGGIRIDSQGRRFRLEGARLWSWGGDGDAPGGQAATFADWWWL